MTDTTLGEADAPARLGGLRHHQFVVLALGMGLGADALVRTRAPLEALGALVLAGLAVPVRDRQSVGEVIGLGLAFLSRRHVAAVWFELLDDALLVHGSSSVRMRAYALEHRGRLDLSGADLALARQLTATLDSLATSPGSRHVSLHVATSEASSQTVLCLGSGRVGPPWRRDDACVAPLIGADLAQHLWMLERPGHLRAMRGVWRVLRVRDLSAASTPLLWGLQSGLDQVIALHVEVLADERARRRVARGSHESTSNAAAARSLGFRQGARSIRRVNRALSREALVAQGRALMQIGVYVSLWAPDRRSLDALTDAVLERSRNAGVNVERGLFRQARWFSLAMPGSPGW